MSGKRRDWQDRKHQDSDRGGAEGGTGAGARHQLPADVERLTLGELTAAADVSVRTVRYYIAEGLLPPPEGSGPGSAYTRGHLDRLRLIQRLKEAYLPLKEIRRRLSGLSDDDVRSVLAAGNSRAAPVIAPTPELLYDESLAGARDYLALLESPEQYRTEPMALRFPTTAAPLAADQVGNDFRPEPARGRKARAASAPAEMASERVEPGARDATGLWHRIPLGDEAELVISDRVYGRHRDRIDWLVRWARKVFG
jgi:DNA-binding transcriptional MerR regulator